MTFGNKRLLLQGEHLKVILTYIQHERLLKLISHYESQESVDQLIKSLDEFELGDISEPKILEQLMQRIKEGGLEEIWPELTGIEGYVAAQNGDGADEVVIPGEIPELIRTTGLWNILVKWEAKELTKHMEKHEVENLDDWVKYSIIRNLHLLNTTPENTIRLTINDQDVEVHLDKLLFNSSSVSFLLGRSKLNATSIPSGHLIMMVSVSLQMNTIGAKNVINSGTKTKEQRSHSLVPKNDFIFGEESDRNRYNEHH